MGDFIDSIIMGILDPILNMIKTLFGLIFSNRISTLIFGFVFMNLIGFTLMRLDKDYAKEDKRRIKESTLFLVAILFGSLGIWAGMYKFRHKTLHKQFTIGIPIIIIAQVIFVIYSIVNGIFID